MLRASGNENLAHIISPLPLLTNVLAVTDAGSLGVLAPTPNASFVLDADTDEGRAVFVACRAPPPGRLSPAAAARCFFAGRLLGAAVRAANPVPIDLPPLTWKQLVRCPVGPADAATVDAATALAAAAGEPGAAASAAALLRESPAARALRAGLERSLGHAALGAMTWRDLRDAAAGAPGFDAADMRAATRVDASGPGAAAVVSYFWETMAAFTPAYRSAVLAFATGRARLPRPPAVALVIEVEAPRHANPAARLPTASTCALTLRLPLYPSAAALAERLRAAVDMGMGAIDGGACRAPLFASQP